MSCSAALSIAREVAIIAGNNSAFVLQVINGVTSLLAARCCCLKNIESEKNNNEELQSSRGNEINQDELISFFVWFPFTVMCLLNPGR